MIISYALILQNGHKHDGGIQEMESNHLSDAAFETTFVTTKTSQEQLQLTLLCTLSSYLLLSSSCWRFKEFMCLFVLFFFLETIT